MRACVCVVDVCACAASAYISVFLDQLENGVVVLATEDSLEQLIVDDTIIDDDTDSGAPGSGLTELCDLLCRQSCSSRCVLSMEPDRWLTQNGPTTHLVESQVRITHVLAHI